MAKRDGNTGVAPSVIAIVSGGLDSTVMLQWAVSRGSVVEVVTFDYGQRHRREIDSARCAASRLGLRHDVVDLSFLGALYRGGGGALLGDVAVPDGHYADESMKATVVPNRNAIMLSIAVGVAIARKAPMVAYAAHAGDHAIYPDCRPVFASAMDVVARLADWHEVGIERPFVAMTKAQIVRIGSDLSVPMHQTWSCYKGGDVHCGTCGTCVERREAFAVAGVEDLTVYA